MGALVDEGEQRDVVRPAAGRRHEEAPEQQPHVAHGEHRAFDDGLFGLHGLHDRGDAVGGPVRCGAGADDE